MKRQSIEWFLDKFETSDMMLQAAIELPAKMQHKNCLKAFERFVEINPIRVKSIFDKLSEAAE